MSPRRNRTLGQVALAVVVAGAAVAGLGLAGCSSDEGGPTGSTAGTATTTTEPEITDAEIQANIRDLRPGLEAAFAADEVDCIISVLQKAGVGDLSADEALDAYQAQCDVSATEVAGAITAADLVDRGASAEAASCVRSAIAALSLDEAADLDQTATDRIYERCGVDAEGLSD